MADSNSIKDEPSPPNSNKLTACGLKHWPNCYFDDSYVVLALGHDGFLFRIYRSILIDYSQMFRDMLESSTPEGSLIEGASVDCPIKLPDDDPEHFAGVLSIYYGPVLIPRPEKPSFEYTTGVFRLASKYKFTLAIDWAADMLRVDWSPKSNSWLRTLANPSQDDIGRAIALINVCRETNVDEFLGCAFYLLCAEETCGDDSLMYEPLQKADIIVLMRGSRKLCRLYAEQAQQGRLTSFSMNSDTTKSTASPFGSPWSPIPNQTGLGLGTPRTWETFICDPITIRSVFSFLELDIPGEVTLSAVGLHLPPSSAHASDSATGTSSPSYAATQDKEPGTKVTEHYQSITAMPAYKGHSFEELRIGDYQQGRKISLGPDTCLDASPQARHRHRR